MAETLHLPSLAELPLWTKAKIIIIVITSFIGVATTVSPAAIIMIIIVSACPPHLPLLLCA